MSAEIELKLEVEPDDLALIRQDSLFAHCESHSNHQVTVYYDTPETRLKAHGLSLRVRNAEGRFVQTLKTHTDGSIGLISREEIECEVPSLEPNLSLLPHQSGRELLDDSEVGSLREVMRSEVNRTSWIVDRRNGRIQVDLDHGIIRSGDRCDEFAELEFELHEGPLATLLVVARQFADHAPVRLGVLTKAERGFLVAENSLAKSHKAQPVRIHSGMTVAEAFHTIVGECLKHYRLNERAVLRKHKAGALHQARVAMRRLRAALSLFKSAVEDVEFQHLRHELRWFTSQLGDARNLDVFLQRELGEDERSKLVNKRERAYRHVADAIDSHSFRRLLIDLVGWAAIGAWRRGKAAQKPIEEFAYSRLDRLWASISRANGTLGRMDESTRHELRIRVKKLRYAVEFLQGLYSDARTAETLFRSAIEELQESLGKLNDMATFKTVRPEADDNVWLIGSLEERRQLISAEDSLRELVRAGPFWRQRDKIAHI